MASSIRDDGPERMPPWFMPAPMIGGHVAGPSLVARTTTAVMAVRQVLAYPTGIRIDIEAHARGPRTRAPGRRDPFERRARLQFRIRFADGRETAQDEETGLRNGRGPMLKLTSAENSSNDRSESTLAVLWVWPLPPPGPVTLT